MIFVLKEIRKVIKYGDPILLGCSIVSLISGLWFMFFGISGLIN